MPRLAEIAHGVRNIAKTLIPFIAIALFLASCTDKPGTLQGRVVNVSDGDTITVLDSSKKQHKVRLAGIDAPEKKQSFGRQSKESLSLLVFNRQVTIELGKTDRYGRTVSKVDINGVDANLEQIKMGMAWHYKKYQKEQSIEDMVEYARAEGEARADRRGLWRDSEPIAPWDFRKASKEK